MPRAAKPLQTLDLHIIDVLENYFSEFGVSRNQVVVRSGIGNNRAGTLFRKEGPGITAGEIFLLAGVLGIPASQIVLEAEAAMVAEEEAAAISSAACESFDDCQRFSVFEGEPRGAQTPSYARNARRA